MRVLGLVPARGGSSRLPGKNLAELGGRTLVRRALDTALASERLSVVALSSEDPRILAEGHPLAGVVLLERPPELATDTALAYDVVLDALAQLEDAGHGPFDAVALIQCTSPFTAPEDIDGVITLLEESGAGSAVSVAPVEHAVHPLKLKRLKGDRLVPFLEDDRMAPSQDLPELWVRNGSVYVTRTGVLAAGKLVSEDVRGYRMAPERSLDINTTQDLAFAEFLLSTERGP